MAKRDLPKVETRLYINGKWQTGTEGTFEVINPATGETLANVQKGGESETHEAIKAAKKAFTHTYTHAYKITENMQDNE